jgi:membrane protein DedA with SNARE-associated domain
MVLDTTAVVGLLVPSDALLLTASAAAGPAGAPLVAAAAVLGTLTGWSLSWWLGTRFAARIRGSRIGTRVGAHRWSTAEQLLAGEGARVLLVVQFLPVVNALVPLLAGSLRMPYRRFLGHACVGTVAWASVYATLGAAAGAVGAFPLLLGGPGLVIGALLLRRATRAARVPAAPALAVPA